MILIQKCLHLHLGKGETKKIMIEVIFRSSNDTDLH